MAEHGMPDRGSDGHVAHAAIDPLFATPVWRHDLQLPKASCTRATADWLTHAVARTPRDLVAHVLRIRVLSSLADPVGLADAVADLWIALGDAGATLKSRMLDEVMTGLPDTAKQYFSAASPAASSDTPWGGCPVLGTGYVQRPVVVRS